MKLAGSEERALRFILQKDAPDLLYQLPQISPRQREYTGIGVYLDLDNTSLPGPRHHDGWIGTGVTGTRSDLDPSYLGFAVSVTLGLIDYREIIMEPDGVYPCSLDGIVLR